MLKNVTVDFAVDFAEDFSRDDPFKLRVQDDPGMFQFCQYFGTPFVFFF